MNMKLKEEATKAFRGEIVNDVNFAYGVSKDYQDQFKGYRKFTKWQRDHLNKLAPLIEYQNVIFKSKEDLKRDLKINDQGNLLRFFRQIDRFVEITSSRDDPENVPVGWLKIEVNPAYLWRVSLQKDRQKAIGEWYLFRELAEESRWDIVLTPYYQKLHPQKNLFDKV